MRVATQRFLAVALLVAACRGGKEGAATPAGEPAAARPTASSDVCAVLPGALVATTLGGRLAEARPSASGSIRRCTYFLTASGDTTRRAFVVYFLPAGEYDDLKSAQGDLVQPERGLGDAAYRYRDPDTRRFWITTLKRPRVTLQVTGDSLAEVRSLTALALSRF